MNLLLVKNQIIRELRGKFSQGQLSRKLGYSFNQIYRWESGRTRFLWADFVMLCQLRKIPLGAVLRKTFRYEGPVENETLLLKHLIGGRTMNIVARELEVSRFSLRRWVNGAASLPFEVVLQLTLHMGELEHFVGEIVPLESIEELKTTIEKRRLAEKLFLDHPVAVLILILLELKIYRELKTHRRGWFKRSCWHFSPRGGRYSGPGAPRRIDPKGAR